MRNLFTTEAIRETKTYKTLAKNNKIVKCNFLENRRVREIITHAYHVYKNTGIIPTTVNEDQLSVVKDFIALDNIVVNLDNKERTVFGSAEYHRTHDMQGNHINVTPAKTLEEAEEWCKRQLTRKPYQ